MAETIMQESIDALLSAAASAREQIREAHGVLKDLRQEIARARRLKDDLVKEVMAEVVPLGQRAIDELADRLHELRLRETAGSPITMMCSRCGQLLALVATRGAQLKCASCGHKFMLREEKDSRPNGMSQ